MTYERLMIEYSHIKIIEDADMPIGLGGLCKNKVIYINKHISKYDKHTVLAEEIGHYETTYGNITDQSIVRNRQLESVARRWAYRKIVSLENIVDCYIKGHTTLYDMCCHLEISPEFLKTSIDYYIAKYGASIEKDEFLVMFEPLNVQKII